MIRNNKPYVPPVCPIFKSGGDFDIQPEEFYLYVGRTEVDNTGAPTKVELMGAFYDGAAKPNEVPAQMGTDLVTEPIDSALADLAMRLHPGEISWRHQRMGEIFCQRIIGCQGIRENGECWALGRQGVKEAIQEYDDETHPRE